MLFDPSPCHKLSHLLGPSPPSSVTYFMDGPYLEFTVISDPKRKLVTKVYSAVLTTGQKGHWPRPSSCKGPELQGSGNFCHVEFGRKFTIFFITCIGRSA